MLLQEIDSFRHWLNLFNFIPRKQKWNTAEKYLKLRLIVTVGLCFTLEDWKKKMCFPTKFD